MRDSGRVSISPNLAKSIFGHGGRSSAAPAPAPVARPGAVDRGFHELLHVASEDSSVQSGALDGVQIDPELAREFAHGRARVRLVFRLGPASPIDSGAAGLSASGLPGAG